MDAVVWNEGVFALSSYTLEAIEAELVKCYFAAFVFTPDDTLTSRGESKLAVRDNLLIEFGISFGRLGRLRTFIVQPRGVKDLKSPSDLAGVTVANYDEKHGGGLNHALGFACGQVRDAVKRIGPAVRTNESRGAGGLDDSTSPVPAPNLSPDVRRLLAIAATDPNGMILQLNTNMGCRLQSGGETFGEAGNARETAKWLGALDELVALGAVKDCDGKKKAFEVTSKGYKPADSM